MRGQVVQDVIDALAPLDIPVYEWRVAPFQLSELPAIVVMDSEDDTDFGGYETEHSLKIEILLFVAQGEETIGALRSKLNAILGCMPEAERNAVLKVQKIDIDLDHGEQIVGRGSIVLNAEYITRRWEI